MGECWNVARRKIDAIERNPVWGTAMVTDLASGALPTCWSESMANAELEAGKRADAMLDRGDDEGQRCLWARISQAIEALQAQPSSKPD
jgi:hypothetical protein